MTQDLIWLMQPRPDQTLAEMHRSGLLAQTLPEVDALYGVFQNEVHHPEKCTGIHTEMCLHMAERLGLSFRARVAVLLHDLGKALTPKDELPKHVDHETNGLAPVAAVCSRLGLDASVTRLALLTCEFHLHAHRTLEMRSKSLVKFLSQTGLETDAALFADFVGACEADKRGRLGKMEAVYVMGNAMRAAHVALQDLPMLPGLPLDTHEGGLRYRARLTAVRNATAAFRPGNSVTPD